jgi:AcrR family transcriptional regulator
VAVVPALPDEDFRVSSAARKRERMRRRLLDATMTACAERGPQLAIIEDVLRAAGVSRGTFYMHFNSLHEAISALRRVLADEFVHGFKVLYQDVDDPVLRAAAGPQLVLSRAVLEPNWGRIIARSEHFSSDSIFGRAIRENIMLARRRGGFRVSDVDAAVDLHVGTLTRGADQLQERKRGRATYIREIATMLLRALGLPESKAMKAVQWGAEDLGQRAPGVLSWWRPFS